MLVRDYLLNYAHRLIYTTAGYSLDLLDDDMSEQVQPLLPLTRGAADAGRGAGPGQCDAPPCLAARRPPPGAPPRALAARAGPIIPLRTPRTHALAAHLAQRGPRTRDRVADGPARARVRARGAYEGGAWGAGGRSGGVGGGGRAGGGRGG
ncbi:hypothetical protein BC834DRAFT_897499 [Gloeopeniophorella convolvens]|nr:hypothetical protein BC834DRAFT_897499 [Gloeopeniophorella convolvens]